MLGNRGSNKGFYQITVLFHRHCWRLQNRRSRFPSLDRGTGEGDPLSPSLFAIIVKYKGVLVAELKGQKPVLFDWLLSYCDGSLRKGETQYTCF